MKIPERLTSTPIWMGTPAEELVLPVENGRTLTLDEVMARDLISLHFWAQVDARAQRMAEGVAKKHPDWNILKPLKDQSEEVLSVYQSNIEYYTRTESYRVAEDRVMQHKILALAHDQAYNWTSSLENNLDQIRTRIALSMSEQNLQQDLPEEFGSISDYLRSKMVPWDGEGERPPSHYEIDFMVKYLIPTLEHNGFSRHDIIGIQVNFWKARYASRYLRGLLGVQINAINRRELELQENPDDPEIEKRFERSMKVEGASKEILETLVHEMVLSKRHDPSAMSNKRFQKHMQELNGDILPSVKEPVAGYVYNTATGAIVMFQVTPQELNELKRLLPDVKWTLSEPEELAKVANATLIASELGVKTKGFTPFSREKEDRHR